MHQYLVRNQFISWLHGMSGPVTQNKCSSSLQQIHVLAYDEYGEGAVKVVNGCLRLYRTSPQLGVEFMLQVTQNKCSTWFGMSAQHVVE